MLVIFKKSIFQYEQFIYISSLLRRLKGKWKLFFQLIVNEKICRQKYSEFWKREGRGGALLTLPFKVQETKNSIVFHCMQISLRLSFLKYLGSIDSKTTFVVWSMFLLSRDVLILWFYSIVKWYCQSTYVIKSNKYKADLISKLLTI